MINTIHLPANCTMLDEEELCYTSGGAGVESVLGGIFATGVCVGLVYLGAKAAMGIFEGLGFAAGTAVKGGAKLWESAANAIGSQNEAAAS